MYMYIALFPPAAQNTVKAYPCGSDHTPSPMASRTPLDATAVWEHSAARLTAVAVSVREGHSIAFLGDSKGTLHKVCPAHTPPPLCSCSALWTFPSWNLQACVSTHGNAVQLPACTTRITSSADFIGRSHIKALSSPSTEPSSTL